MKTLYGLVILFLIVLLSGCVQTLPVITSTSMEDIVNNLPSYENKTVTVTGTVNSLISAGEIGGKGIYYQIIDSKGYSLYLIEGEHRTFENGKTYTITGRIMKLYDTYEEKDTYILDLRSQEEFNKDVEEQKCPDNDYPFYDSNIDYKCRIDSNSNLICDIQDKGNCLTKACISVNYFSTMTSKVICDYCVNATNSYTLSCDLSEYNNTDYIVVKLSTMYNGKYLILIGSEDTQTIILHQQNI
jgi:hypothetical protein